MAQSSRPRAAVEALVGVGAWRAVCVGLTLLGCTPDFDEPWLVKDLRILAIKADPPEVIFLRDPPASGVLDTPAAGVPDPTALLAQIDPQELSVTLEVLAVDPRDPQRQVDWEVWVCSADESFCQDDSAFTRRLAQRRTTLNEISFVYTPTPEQVLAFFEGDRFRGFGGLPFTLEFRLDDGDRVVRGFKRVVYTFWLPYSPVPRCKQPNRAPRLDGVEAGDEGLVEDDTPPITAKPEQRIVLDPIPSGERAKKRIAECPDPLAEQEPPEEEPCELDPPEESRENYWVVTAEDPLQATPGEPTLGSLQLCEFLSYAFFTSAGELSHATTGGAPNPFVEIKKIEDPTSEWTAPAAPPDEPVQLWVVIRDDRGGTDWLSFTAEIE